MIKLPIKQQAHPQIPNRPSFSSRRKEARMALVSFEGERGQLSFGALLPGRRKEDATNPIMTLRAPSGVTKIGGANWSRKNRSGMS